MSKNVKFEHQRSPAFAHCGDKGICQVRLVNTSPKKHAAANDNLKFERVGDEAKNGFKVTIDPPFTNGGSFSTSNQNLTIAVPNNQAVGSYEYKIYYDKDTDAIVAPLDPIIIIQPDPVFSFMTFIRSNSTGLLIGAVFGAVVTWLLT